MIARSHRDRHWLHRASSEYHALCYVNASSDSAGLIVTPADDVVHRVNYYIYYN